jgi:hypothetical protein
VAEKSGLASCCDGKEVFHHSTVIGPSVFRSGFREKFKIQWKSPGAWQSILYIRGKGSISGKAKISAKEKVNICV